jgi:ribosomal protein L6P/L9E
MKSHNLNYLIIPKHIFCDITNTQKYNYIWFSGNFGTIFQKIPFGYNIIKRGNMIFFNPINFKSFSKNYDFKSFYHHFQKLQILLMILQYFIISSSYGFKRFLKIRGRSYKWFLNSQKQIEILVGLSHSFKMTPWSKLLFKISFKGKKINFRFKSLLTLKNLLVELRKKRIPNYVSGKGIRYLKDRAQKRIRIYKRL